MKDNIFDHLIESDPENADILYLIKFNILDKVYNFGDHLNNRKNNNKFKFWVLNILIYLYATIINFYKRKESKEKRGLSATYLNYDLRWSNDKIEIDRIFYAPKKNGQRITLNLKIYLQYLTITQTLIYKDFNELVNKKFYNQIQKYYNDIEKLIIKNDYEFLLISNDTEFHNRLLIKIFKKYHKQTFIIAHGGMPNLYDGVLENSSDFVTTWGKKQKDAFINNGYPKNKYFVSGHPIYNKLPQSLKFEFGNILILTKSVNGVCPLDKNQIEDRGMSLLYLLLLQQTLKKIGITKVNLRPHPSENISWYKKYIDLNFFNLDNNQLSKTLSKSTLVIGPISTVFIDALYNSINYVVFEPIIDNKTILGYPITAPLDGNDKRIPIARNESELYEILINKRSVDLSVYEEFVQTPFDSDLLMKILYNN